MCRGFCLGLVVFCSVTLACCAKSNEAEVKGVSSNVPVETVKEVPLTLEQQKLQRVIASLPHRTQDGITNGDTLELLADLNKVLASDTDNLLQLVDKKHLLKEDFVPEDIIPLKPNDSYNLNRNDLSLRIPAEASLRQMAEEAKKDGIKLLVSSTYRSYDYQANLYARNVKQLGKEVADRESAPPGASQHHLGTAVDFGSITDSFAETEQGIWLVENAGKFGWSLSYPDGYEDVTGYRWECWHYRYIGVEAVNFQKKWFSDVQQYMLEFIHAWKTIE